MKKTLKSIAIILGLSLTSLSANTMTETELNEKIAYVENTRYVGNYEDNKKIQQHIIGLHKKFFNEKNKTVTSETSYEKIYETN